MLVQQSLMLVQSCDMHMSLNQLKKRVHELLLSYRSMDRLVESRQFQEAYDLTKDKAELINRVLEADTDYVNKHVGQMLETEVGTLSMSQLRQRASDLGIARYTTYTKDQLIVHIIQVLHARRIKETPGRVPPQAIGFRATSGR